MNSNKKKIVFDMILNIIAATVPIAVLQLLIYPIVARDLGSGSYGLMITIYSVWMMVSNSFGNVLNNVRLLYDGEYQENNLEGDFLRILGKMNIFNSIIVSILILYYCKEFNFVHIFLGVVISVLVLIKAYLEVGFRLKLDYKAILANNILQGIGFCIGYIVTYITGLWEMIFLVGYALGCIFCVLKTKLLSEKKGKTELYNKVNKDCYNLIFATILSKAMGYADKLVIYPLMGGHAVSIYYTATILGKIVSMLTGPINSVILSYITKWKKAQKNVLNKVILLGSIVVTGGYFFTILISEPIINMLFPQWADEVMVYLPVTTISVVLLALVSILQPFVLKFCNLKWQVVINGVSLVIYFSAALIMWNIWGLMGFCVGTIIGTVARIAVMLVVYYCVKE